MPVPANSASHPRIPAAQTANIAISGLTLSGFPDRHAGVIAITLAQPNRAALLSHLKDAVERLRTEEEFHRVWLLTDDRLFER